MNTKLNGGSNGAADDAAMKKCGTSGPPAGWDEAPMPDEPPPDIGRSRFDGHPALPDYAQIPHHGDVATKSQEEEDLERIDSWLEPSPSAPIETAHKHSITPATEGLLNPAEIQSALNAMDPAASAGVWLRVGKSLHGISSGAESFNMWMEWSQRRDGCTEADCISKWRRFRPLKPTQSAQGMLFSLAYKLGWSGQISLDENVLPLIAAQYRRVLHDFSRRYGIAAISGKSVVVYREFDANVDRMTTRFSTVADMKVLYQPVCLPFIVINKDGSKGIGEAPLIDTWMSSRIRKTYQQVMFAPKAGLIAGGTELPNDTALNLYLGLSVKPIAGNCHMILDHIKDVWCSGNMTTYNYVVDWMARMLQQPGERGHTVIVLRSGEGTGKNIIADLLVDIFGDHAYVAVRTEALVGKFNDHLATSIFVFANESIWGGDKGSEGAMKSLITDPDLDTERKYIPKYRVRNCCHLMMASNNDWVAPIGFDDRRFVVLDVSEARKGDFEYFRELVDQIKDGGTAAFADYLLSRDISKFDPRILPDVGLASATKSDAKIRTADSITQWVHHVLLCGEITSVVSTNEGVATHTPHLLRSVVNLAEGWRDSEVRIRKEQLHKAYVEWTSTMRRHPEGLGSFTKKIKQLIHAKQGKQLSIVDQKRPDVYILGDLGVSRKAFEGASAQPWDWGESEGD